MIRKSIGTFLVVCLLLVWSLVGCAIMQKAFSTPEKQYLSARTEYNKQLTSYVQLFQKQDGATKEIWKVKYTPIFVAADTILDGWSMSLSGNLPSIQDEQKWLDMKNKLIDLIVELSGVKGGQ